MTVSKKAFMMLMMLMWLTFCSACEICGVVRKEGLTYSSVTYTQHNNIRAEGEQRVQVSREAIHDNW
jgi:hypothetical protein